MHSQISLDVAIYHGDYFGHVNNAVYLDFMQQAVSEMINPSLHGYLTPRRCRVDYIKSVQVHERIQVDTWITREATFFQITNQQGDAAVRARIEWQDHMVLSAELVTLADTTVAPFILKDLRNTTEDTKGKPFVLPVYVSSRDLTTDGSITAAAYMRWSEMGFETAAQKSGWSARKNLSLNWISFAITQDLEVYQVPTWDDVLVITSYLHDARKIRGVWRHDIINRDTNVLMARNYVGGAFLNLQGQITPPPDGLIEDCFKGERE